MSEGATPTSHVVEGAPSAFDIELQATLAGLCSGNFAQRMGTAHAGLRGEIAHTLNTHLAQLGVFYDEVTRVLHRTAVEGRLGARAEVPGLLGSWKAIVDQVNAASSILTDQIRSSSKVLKAYAEGDLSGRVSVPAQGEMLELKETINTLAESLEELKSAVARLVERQKSIGL